MIIYSFGSGKTNALLHLINNKLDIDKIYLHAKNPYKAKYQCLVSKREKVGVKYYDNRKAFMEYSNDMQDVYKNIEQGNPKNKRKILKLFDNMIADMLSNKKLNPVVTELFLIGTKPHICFGFIMQSYFAVPKNIRLNSMHYYIMKNLNKRELHQIIHQIILF